LKKLDALADEADHAMTTAILDRNIASKAKGNFTSNLTYTQPSKNKQSGKKQNGVNKDSVFRQSNPSPINSLQPATRSKQKHPGSKKHVHWTKLKFCKYCNDGWVTLTQHKKSHTCRRNAAEGQLYTQCLRCCNEKDMCIGHPDGVACPAAKKNAEGDSQ
jgi:hypothetical protein